jgi:hypothetical protein
MSYLVKRAGIGIGNILTILTWDAILLSLSIISTLAYNKLNELPNATDMMKSLNNGLKITLWIFFVLFIPASYFGIGNPYNNAIVLGVGFIIGLITLIIAIILYTNLNQLGLEENDVTNTIKNYYISLMIASGIGLLMISIYVPISLYKYKKSGGINADISNTLSAVTS